jgi:nondiscriminating aspartyl-tRNA synthetase
LSIGENLVYDVEVVKQKTERILTKDTPNFVGKKIRLEGWIRLRRDHGKLIFFDLRDRSGIIQVVVNPKASEASYQLAKELKPEDVVEVLGTVKKRPQDAFNKDLLTGEVEIEAEGISFIAKSEVLPFDMGGERLNLELPTLLDYRSLVLRHPSISPIFKIQAEIVKAFRQIAQRLECSEIFVPTIVASATEGGAEVFPIDYYGHKAYLSQSPQLYKQMLIPVFERVYTISKAYRAEPSVTTRHLSESTQMDFEFGFVEFYDLLDLLEEAGVYILETVEKECKKELGSLGVEKISFGKIPRLTLREAQEIILKEKGRNILKEPDLSSQDEADICQWALKTHKSDLVTITHYPIEKRAFYTMPDPKDPEYSLSYDLLFRGTEILSGSQRINNYQMLVDAMEKRGLNPKNFTLYLQAFE